MPVVEAEPPGIVLLDDVPAEGGQVATVAVVVYGGGAPLRRGQAAASDVGEALDDVPVEGGVVRRVEVALQGWGSCTCDVRKNRFVVLLLDLLPRFCNLP